MPQRVMVLLAGLTLATALLAGCGGQDTPVEQAEEEAGVEAIVEEETAAPYQAPPRDVEETTAPYQAPPRDAEEAAADKAKAAAAEKKERPRAQGSPSDSSKGEGLQLSAGDQERVNVLYCQTEEIFADVGYERADAIIDEILRDQAAGEYENVQEGLYARGYTCGGRYEEAFGS